MRSTSSFFLAFAVLATACSNGTGTSSSKGNGGSTSAGPSTTGTNTTVAATATGATAGNTSGATTGTGSSGGIPDPGTTNQVDVDFTDVEPNNTPQTATPLGVGKQAGVAVWVGGNTIGGSNTADYFVFKEGPTAGPFNFNICFGTGTTAVTATLWKVVNGAQQMPPVGTWSSTPSATGGCVTDNTAAPMLDANAEYLFGLTATGGSSSYSA